MTTTPARRVEGWEQRLERVIDATRARPYKLGESDCLRLACDAEAALLSCGSRWVEWAGRYATTEEAVALIMERGGFVAAFSNFFSADPVNVTQARRGDICLLRDREERMYHLTVCVGSQVAAYAPRGLVFLPTLDCTTTWRIG